MYWPVKNKARAAAPTSTGFPPTTARSGTSCRWNPRPGARPAADWPTSSCQDTRTIRAFRACTWIEHSIRRILAWIDLNVPYYGTSETAYPERVGCRQVYPDRLDEVLAGVAARRCATCHDQGKIPRANGRGSRSPSSTHSCWRPWLKRTVAARNAASRSSPLGRIRTTKPSSPHSHRWSAR